MEEGYTLLGDFLKGRSLYAPMRRLLNLVFTTSLTSYAYIYFYGAYEVMDLVKGETLLRAFVSGTFIIPFSLFVIVYYLTQWGAALIFEVAIYIGTFKLARRLIRSKWSQKHIRLWLQRIYRSSKYAPQPLSPALMQQVLAQVKTELTHKALVDMKKSLEVPIKAAEASFILFVRTVIAITVYFNALPQFGHRLFWSVLVVLVIAMVIVCFGVILLKVIPEMLMRLRQECDRIISILDGQRTPEQGS